MKPFDHGLVVESPHATLDDYLARYGLEVTRLDAVPDTASLIDAIRETGSQVLFKRSRVPVTAEVIEACEDLHAIQLCCIGDDSVDKEAAARHGVLVFNDPFSNARSVVELAMGHLIALSRRLYETNTEVHRNEWNKNNRQRYEIMGKRLGIVGLGNIGRQVARAAEAFGMEVAFFDNRPVAVEIGQEMGWDYVPTLQALFRTSDMITVHTSAKDAWGRDNAGLLDDVLAELGAERPDNAPRLFLNLARGNVHSAEALRGAVSSGAIRRAAVDVYPEEPAPGAPAWSNPYADLPVVVGTPHIGAATQEAQPRIARRVARTLGEFSRVGTVRDCVYSPRAKLRVPPPRPGCAVLAVVHSTSVGTNKAVADAIYGAKASTMASSQQDFDNGIAYDLSVLDRPLPPVELQRLVETAKELADDPTAIRAVRQMVVPSSGW